MLRALCVLLVTVWAAPAVAQAPARKPRTLAGVCGATNWACVAECIDVTCVDRCFQKGCDAALDRLRQCARQSGCGADDTRCVAQKCGATCERSFEPAPPSPEKEKTDPCAGAASAQVPGKVVGTWVLSAASLKPGEYMRKAEEQPNPRPDFERLLEVRPNGCFTLQTQLEDATLGRGNELRVRAWGTFEVTNKKEVVLRIRDGQAVGPVCGKARVISLSKGRFQNPPYTLDVEKDTLTLTAEAPSKQTFQFERQTPHEEKKEEKREAKEEKGWDKKQRTSGTLGPEGVPEPQAPVPESR
jgi:hypothetical protein